MRKVEISPDRNAPAVAEGKLVFIDNTVKPQTGTILLKARVKNEKEELWPGQFVAARIVLRVEQEAVVVPEAAVQPGQDGTFVYLVEGRQGAGPAGRRSTARSANWWSLPRGSTAAKRVITEVPPTLAAGAQVVAGGRGRQGRKGRARARAARARRQGRRARKQGARSEAKVARPSEQRSKEVKP